MMVKVPKKKVVSFNFTRAFGFLGSWRWDWWSVPKCCSGIITQYCQISQI